jgi:hypothetical protein
VGLPVVVLDSLRDFVEVPLLSSSVLSPSLQPDIVGTMTFNHSLHWKPRSDIEWSIDVETEFFIQTLCFCLGCFIKVDNIPFLVDTLVVVEYSNRLSLNIISGCIEDSICILVVDKLRS